ncbi:unnamed protein product [Musa acuminata var. zebrina]
MQSHGCQPWWSSEERARQRRKKKVAGLIGRFNGHRSSARLRRCRRLRNASRRSRRPSAVPMGRTKKQGVLLANQAIYQGATLREENTGVKQVDVSSILRMQHLQRLATWASKEARVAPLAAFLGERLASKAEASGIPLDPSTLLCERCETILQPGNSCSVRIEKVTNKRRRRVNKSRFPRQNNVIYTCHFCSHRNLKPGTAKGHVHALLDAHPGHTSSRSNSYGPMSEIKGDSGVATKVLQHDAAAGSVEPELNSGLNSSGPDTNAAAGSVATKSPVTPLMKLINKSKKKRKKADDSTTNNSLATADSGRAIGGSSKRRRKGWSSLKEIVESSESKNDRSISNLAIPFLLA